MRLQDREDTIKRLTRQRDDAVRKNRTPTAELEGVRKRLISQSTTEDTPVAKTTRSKKLCNYDENTANRSVIGRRKERKPDTAVDKPSFSPEAATQKGFLESVTKVVEQVIDSKLKENMTEKKMERRLKNERARNLIIHGLEQQPVGMMKTS